MKKTVLLCVVLVVVAFASNAQDQRRFSIQINPVLCSLYYISGLARPEPQFFVDFDFHAKLTDHFTLFVNPTCYSWDIGWESTYRRSNGYGMFGETWESYPFMTFNVSGGLLYRPTGSGLSGWFIGVYPLVGYTIITDKTNDRFINAGGMADFGYEWIFKNGFMLTLGGGLGYIHSIPLNGNQYNDYENPDLTIYGINYWGATLRAKAKLAIGYAF